MTVDFELDERELRQLACLEDKAGIGNDNLLRDVLHALPGVEESCLSPSGQFGSVRFEKRDREVTVLMDLIVFAFRRYRRVLRRAVKDRFLAAQAYRAEAALTAIETGGKK